MTSKPLRFMRRPASFWRAAVAASLAAAAIGLATASPSLSITNPGVLPLWMMIAALALAGPPRRFEKHSTRDISVLTLATLGIGWPVLQALGVSIEKNAALLSVPYVALAGGAIVLGWRLRQQDPDLPLLCFLGAGVFRAGLVLSSSNTPTSEVYWWGVVAIWMIGVFVLAPMLRKRVAESAPLIAVLAWFVLMVGTMTVVEYRNPAVEFVAIDDRAAMGAWRAAPITGHGFGGFDSAMREFSTRQPVLAPFQSRGALRLLVDIGLPATLCIAFVLVLSVAYTATERPFDRARASALGAAVLWLVAVVSIRQPIDGMLPALALLWPAALGRVSVPDTVPSEDFIPSYTWLPMGAVLGLLMIPGVVFPVANWHYERQNPRQEIGARSFLVNWGKPYADQAWLIRSRSGEISRSADPRVMLRRPAENWVRVEPRSHFAQFEVVRWAHSTLPLHRAERIALRAHDRLPWSQEIAAYVVRIRIEDNRQAEALEWLERYGAQYGPLAPVLRSRLEELQRQVRRRR